MRYSQSCQIGHPCNYYNLTLTLYQRTKFQSKLKAFADNKIDMTEKLKFVFGRIENIVGKGENAGYQHFLHFLQCFQKAFYAGWLKVVIVW